MQLERVSLENDFVCLDPIDESHREGLRAAASDRAIWKHWVRETSDWDATFADQMAKESAGEWLHFTVFDSASGAIIGQTCFLELRPAHGGVEIGGTWYAPQAQGGPINPANGDASYRIRSSNDSKLTGSTLARASRRTINWSIDCQPVWMYSNGLGMARCKTPVDCAWDCARITPNFTPLSQQS